MTTMMIKPTLISHTSLQFEKLDFELKGGFALSVNLGLSFENLKVKSLGLLTALMYDDGLAAFELRFLTLEVEVTFLTESVDLGDLVLRGGRLRSVDIGHVIG